MTIDNIKLDEYKLKEKCFQYQRKCGFICFEKLKNANMLIKSLICIKTCRLDKHKVMPHPPSGRARCVARSCTGWPAAAPRSSAAASCSPPPASGPPPPPRPRSRCRGSPRSAASCSTRSSCASSPGGLLRVPQF